MIIKEKQAEKLAEFIHCGQKRFGGEDYIEHPRRVAEALKKLGYGEDVVCAAWMHDLEDFQFSGPMFSIINQIFGEKVFGFVMLLSRMNVSYVSYEDYVYNIAKTSEDALAIKWQDMIDNTNNNIPKRQWEKYRNACQFLRSKGIEIPEILKKRLKIE